MSNLITNVVECQKDIAIEYEHTYEEDVRIEECHGLHRFYDVTDVSKRIISVKIELSKNKFIDITDRLTIEEIEILMD